MPLDRGRPRQIPLHGILRGEEEPRGEKGPGKGEKAADVPEDACPKLLSWPYVCNGCRLRNYHCPKRWQAEYRAARAQALADGELSASRRGIDKTREQFEHIMSHVNSEPRPSLVGLSPIRMFRLAYGGLAERLLDALGIEEIGPGELNLTPSLLAHEEGRGMTI